MDRVIREDQELLNYLCQLVKTTTFSPVVNLDSQPATESDEDLYRRICRADNGKKFTDLFSGNIQNYTEYGNDRSRVDQALLSILDFYSKDVDQVARLFKYSRLYRPEKGRRGGDGTDYILRSLKRARAFNKKDNPPINATALMEKLEEVAEKQLDADSSFSIPIPVLRSEGYYKLLGEIAWAGSVHSEAVPAALAINILAYFCAVLGPTLHIAIGDDFRALRIFALVTGPTSKGRKGYSTKLPRRIFDAVGKYLILPRFETNVSSGEGLVWMVRDELKDAEGKVIDVGVQDKRVLLEIPEFGGVLAQAKRDTSVLTAIMRAIWDGVRLSTPNKNNPCFATNHHFVLLAHITREELSKLLNNIDIKNGFVNRFMMVYSARNKIVDHPLPTPQEVVDGFAERVARAIKKAWERNSTPVQLTDDAKSHWSQMRRELENRSRTSDVESLMARADTYLLVFAAAIALINEEQQVESVHLDAALAWIDFWEDTVNFCFTTAAKYDEIHQIKELADEIVETIDKLGGSEVPRTHIGFKVTENSTNKEKRKLFDRAIDFLLAEAPPRVTMVNKMKKGRGRPANLFSIVKKEA